MKRIVSIFIACILVIALVGCGGNSNGHEGEAKTPSGSSVQKGRNYQKVIDDFEEKGFKNIKTEKLEDLITGWMTKDGEVESVSVDGNKDYSPDLWYPNDVEVIITYHTFLKEDENGADSDNKENSESVEQSTAESSKESNQKTEDEVLTVDNNKDFAVLLAVKDPLNPIVSEFAKKYAGRTIEFNGNIVNMMKHEAYKTRFDILIYVGDYSETTSIGPSFKFEDVNISDIHLTGSKIPEYIEEGQNFHIIAKVEKYEEKSGLFLLKPISTEIR